MKRTPIYSVHQKLNAKLIDFGGWEMPVQYRGIIEEHNSVREKAGIFDVSHMGEILVKGKESMDFINFLITNDLTCAQLKKIVYSPMCYENGGCVDDLLVYVKSNNELMLVVNASNTDKDFEWIISNVGNYDVSVENVSHMYAQIALQGPDAQSLLQKVCGMDLDSISFFTFEENVDIFGISTLISRTGYTGEDGFELYFDAENGAMLFEKLLDLGFVPCGLGSRDTLRFESALPLYGHELSPDISPIEAGLKTFVKPYKSNFIGKNVLKDQYENGTDKKIVGFEMLDKGIARSGYEIFNVNGERIGYVTSGSFCPSLNRNMGMALVGKEYSKQGSEIYIDVRNKKLKAITVKKPFYSKKYKNQEGLKK